MFATESATARRVAAVRRADDALSRLLGAPDAAADPLIVVALARSSALGRRVDPLPLVAWLMNRQVHHGRENAMRYRWGLSWRSETGSDAYRRRSGDEVNWRPAEAHKLAEAPSPYGRRLMEPITIAMHLRYWGELADRERDTDIGAAATSLIDEALPVIENDVASWFQALDPWRDAFGLWLLTAEPQAVSRLRDLLFSIAIRYGGLAARSGAVRGIKHPFFDVPLVSASAHLASGLWRMGVYPTVIPGLIDLVSSSRTRDGAWADGDQPPDVLTTLAAADVLSRLDPGYDPAATIEWFVREQEPEGWWRALNPEVPWLTGAVADWLDSADRPFGRRFTWPTSPIWARDRLTGLTTVATLDEIANIFEGLPALGGETLEAAFLDLAGFGEWNTAHGQSRGDDLLGVLGASLAGIPGVLAVRIGGDEFVILGKPSAVGLGEALEAWRARWPATPAAAGMPAAVAPRILLSRARARDLRGLRHFLGDGIAPLKLEVPDPPSEGVLREAEYRSNR